MRVSGILTRRTARAVHAALFQGVPGLEPDAGDRFARDVDEVLAGSHGVLRTFIWSQFLLLEISPMWARFRPFSLLAPDQAQAWLHDLAASDSDTLRGAVLLIKTLGQSIAYTRPGLLAQVGRPVPVTEDPSP